MPRCDAADNDENAFVVPPSGGPQLQLGPPEGGTTNAFFKEVNHDR